MNQTCKLASALPECAPLAKQRMGAVFAGAAGAWNHSAAFAKPVSAARWISWMAAFRAALAQADAGRDQDKLRERRGKLGHGGGVPGVGVLGRYFQNIEPLE